MARWPNVPAVYGWLSLSARGQWRLHPGAQGPGELIASAQITGFIGRNYAGDKDGRWYFQNGPQRVFVDLEAAPWITRTTPGAQGLPDLLTHTGIPFGPVRQWWFDDEGRLFAQAAQGAAIVDGRDLPELLQALQTEKGPLLDILERADPAQAGNALMLHLGDRTADAVPLGFLPRGREAAVLGFVPIPRPNAKIAP